VQLLDRELAEADMGASRAREDYCLLRAHLIEGAGQQTLGPVLETLQAETAHRGSMPTAGERRVFSDAFV
jgi:hypothetical protein